MALQIDAPDILDLIQSLDKSLEFNRMLYIRVTPSEEELKIQSDIVKHLYTTYNDHPLGYDLLRICFSYYVTVNIKINNEDGTYLYDANDGENYNVYYVRDLYSGKLIVYQRCGISISWNDDILISYSYSPKGLKQGFDFHSYEDGYVKSIVPYIDGQYHGLRQVYDNSINRVEQIEYDHGNLSGRYVRYLIRMCRDGSVENIVASSKTYKDGRLNGKLMVRDTEHRTVTLENYHNNKLYGERIVYYYDNNQLQSKGVYNGDICEGLHVRYAKNGNPISALTYKNNDLHGKQYEWYENIRYVLKRRYNMVDGRNHGLHETWVDSNKLYITAMFDSGLRTGLRCKYYDKQLSLRELWKDGYIIWREQYHNSTGVMVRKCTYRGGIKHGYHIIYDKHGRHYNTIYYWKGEVCEFMPDMTEYEDMNKDYDYALCYKNVPPEEDVYDDKYDSD